MRKKNVRIILAAALMLLGMTGCAENQIPEMTSDQTQMVGEFVAVTLMKYDANHRSRLVNLAEYGDSTPSPNTQQSATPPPSGMGPVDNTPVVDSGAASGNYTMEEVLGVPNGIEVTFLGREICDNYPAEGENKGFTLPASVGKKLLVLHFSLTNVSSQDQMVDLISSSASFRVTVNEDYTRYTLPVTMLLDDLSAYSGSLSSGTSVNKVLIIEVDENIAQNISSIRLSVTNDSKTCTIQLA